jgi:hypothetical protein
MYKWYSKWVAGLEHDYIQTNKQTSILIYRYNIDVLKSSLNIYMRLNVEIICDHACDNFKYPLALSNIILNLKYIWI